MVCGAVVVGALRPDPEPHTDVIVAAHALEAGVELAPGDVTRQSWPRRLVPEAAPGAVADVAGRTLAVSVPAGMPLLGGVLTDDALWSDAPAGTVAAPVRLADPELAAMLRAGDRIDVLGVGHEGGAADRLARGAIVLRGLARDESGGGGLFGGAESPASGLVLLAVTPHEATALAEGAATRSLAAVLVQ